MRRFHRILLTLIPAVLSIGVVSVLAATTPAQEGPPSWAEPCVTGGQKWVDPATVPMGGKTTVTMVMTGTCSPYDLPVDVVFVVDRSNSMTRGTGGNLPGPGNPGDPTPGGNVNPTPGDPGGVRPPTQEKPDPTKDPDPPAPTALYGRSASAGQQRIRGLAQGPIIPTSPKDPTTDPRETPGEPTPKTTPDPGGNVATQSPGNDPTRGVVRRDIEEPPGDEDLIREVVQAIADLLDHLEAQGNEGRFRFALVSFNDRARVEADLDRSSNGASRVRSRLSRLRGEGNTRIDLGLSAATRVLYGVTYRGRDDFDHHKVSILYSDGLADPRTTARLRMRDDITYMSVAAGRSANRQVMYQLASEREFALDLRDRQELAERLLGLEARQRDVTLDTVTVSEKLADGMRLVPDSAVPPVTRVLADGTLEWDVPSPATMPVTITYEIEPELPGLNPVSQGAEARWTDSEARAGTTTFPDVSVEVVLAPTFTPSPTATATTVPNNTVEPTVTKAPIQPLVYLPYVSNRDYECKPQFQTVDVALVIDTSRSMSDSTEANGITKINAAIAAGERVVDLLKPGDQAAVISFNQEASLMAELTNDRNALKSALQSLLTVQQQGTFINKGLRLGVDELTGPRHRLANSRAIILVTDGRQHVDGVSDLRAVADQARDAGITVWSVALGLDADLALLREIASRDDTFVHAPSAEDLHSVYEDIARQIPCP